MDGRILSTERLRTDSKLFYNVRNECLEEEDGTIFGFADTALGVPYLIGLLNDDGRRQTPEDYDLSDIDDGYIDNKGYESSLRDVESSDKEDTNDNDRIVFRALSAMEIHRRLGHAGKAKMSATIKDAIMVEDLKIPSCLDIDCEACLLAKSRRKVSREP
jgi:hypothetical protein